MGTAIAFEILKGGVGLERPVVIQSLPKNASDNGSSGAASFAFDDGGHDDNVFESMAGKSDLILDCLVDFFVKVSGEDINDGLGGGVSGNKVGVGEKMAFEIGGEGNEVLGVKVDALGLKFGG